MSSPQSSPDTDNANNPDGPIAAALDEAARLAAELGQSQERLLRLAADFDNFKKRATRDRDDARRSGSESVISRLLPVLDNFDMAMTAAGQPSTTLDSLRTGVTMIHGQFRNMLGEVGVTPIDASGQPFDPSIHEAVSTCPAGDVPDGHVAQQVRPGYRLGDRLLRPASVIVAAKPA